MILSAGGGGLYYFEVGLDSVSVVAGVLFGQNLSDGSLDDVEQCRCRFSVGSQKTDPTFCLYFIIGTLHPVAFREGFEIAFRRRSQAINLFADLLKQVEGRATRTGCPDNSIECF